MSQLCFAQFTESLLSLQLGPEAIREANPCTSIYESISRDHHVKCNHGIVSYDSVVLLMGLSAQVKTAPRAINHFCSLDSGPKVVHDSKPIQSISECMLSLATPSMPYLFEYTLGSSQAQSARLKSAFCKHSLERERSYHRTRLRLGRKMSKYCGCSAFYVWDNAFSSLCQFWIPSSIFYHYWCCLKFLACL